MIELSTNKEWLNKIVEAMKSGDEEQIKQAWAGFQSDLKDQMMQGLDEFKETYDANVLMQRGYRQLTTAETKFYNKVIEALKSNEPKQAFTSIIGTDNEDVIMPETVIEDVYKNLQDEYPLLAAIKFQYVGYITKWVLNDHAVQTAVWGQITDEITKEITSAFRVIDIKQSKLAAFAIIEKGMLDLGPVFLDGYIRTVLAEALMAGLELAIVAGTGVNQPIGLIKDIHDGVSFDTSTGYPNKATEAVKDFRPATYGGLVAKLAVTEKGRKRKFNEVALIVNQADYLTKVMPATTVLNANGVYVNNLFPFPTTVYVSNAVEDGKAVMFLKDEYFLGVGGEKNGVIEYSDEYKFIEDQRVFKIKQYAAGRAFDNTSALYLDISDLAPAYITVLHKEDTVTA